jgi:hypothetical protein
MLQVLNGPTIEAGESLSDAIDCCAGQLVSITIPEEWDKAQLTFQFSSDGETFSDLYQFDGFAATIKTVVEGSTVVVPADVGRATAFVKFRSGTSGNPVAQSERREFSVSIIPTALSLGGDGDAPSPYTALITPVARR